MQTVILRLILRHRIKLVVIDTFMSLNTPLSCLCDKVKWRGTGSGKWWNLHRRPGTSPNPMFVIATSTSFIRALLKSIWIKELPKEASGRARNWPLLLPPPPVTLFSSSCRLHTGVTQNRPQAPTRRRIIFATCSSSFILSFHLESVLLYFLAYFCT